MYRLFTKLCGLVQEQSKFLTFDEAAFYCIKSVKVTNDLLLEIIVFSREGCSKRRHHSVMKNTVEMKLGGNNEIDSSKFMTVFIPYCSE